MDEKELKNWTKYVGFLPQLQGNDIHILCTYTRTFLIPFRDVDYSLFSYNKKFWMLHLREEERQEVNDYLKDPTISDITKTEIIGKYPGSFILTNKKNFWIHHILYPFIREGMPIGQMTGYYYFDLYGYLWIQINAYYLEDPDQLAWVRESTVTYPGKDNYLHLYERIRKEMNEKRKKAENKEKRSNVLSIITAAGVVLLASN